MLSYNTVDKDLYPEIRKLYNMFVQEIIEHEKEEFYKAYAVDSNLQNIIEEKFCCDPQ